MMLDRPLFLSASTRSFRTWYTFFNYSACIESRQFFSLIYGIFADALRRRIHREITVEHEIRLKLMSVFASNWSFVYGKVPAGVCAWEIRQFIIRKFSHPRVGSCNAFFWFEKKKLMNGIKFDLVSFNFLKRNWGELMVSVCFLSNNFFLYWLYNGKKK